MSCLSYSRSSPATNGRRVSSKRTLFLDITYSFFVCKLFFYRVYARLSDDHPRTYFDTI